MEVAVKENIIMEKSLTFSIRIVNLHKYLVKEKKEYMVSKQVYRSGTSIGANIAEAQQAQSKSDFVHKMSIALKEASETNYWIRLLHATDYLNDKAMESMIQDCSELEKMLTVIIKSAKE